jgi:hypothetical protein
MKFFHTSTTSSTFALILLLVALNCAAATIRVDADRKIGRFPYGDTVRPIHGINGGPICFGGLVDLSPYHRTLGIPLTRLHDTTWPDRDVVNIHAVFPDFLADPESPASYRFGPTDDFIKAVLATGSKVVYRLGENIEHTPHKYYVHKPANFDRWAAICLGIIRHYNEGWAGGFHHDIRYFEMWNEADLGPLMWDGTSEDYYRLYAVTARAIKARYPKLKVGGPAVVALGKLDGDRLTPCPHLRGFLEYCRKESLPLDFVSWHMYTPDPTAPVRGAIGLRRVLDEYGFKHAESHLNEWNYLPNGDWSPMHANDGPRLQKWFEDAGGARGAAFVASVLLGLQDAPLDMANFFSGDTIAWGLFNQYGVPKKTYYAFLAFKALVDHPLRVAAESGIPGEIAAVAGLSPDRHELALVVSNFRRSKANVQAERVEFECSNLPWSGPSEYELLVLDDAHNLESLNKQSVTGPRISIVHDLPAPGVLLLYVRKGIQ